MENPTSKRMSFVITHSNTSKWADLPKDVLIGIAHLLDYKTDIPRLRGVCPSWRSALPLSEFPMREIHLEVPCIDGIRNNLPLFLLKTRYYHFYPLSGGPSCKGWIARVGELGLNKWRLLNPLYYNNVIQLRYFYTDPPIKGEINLLDCRVVELARPMSLVHKLGYNERPVSKKVVCGERAVLVLLDERKVGDRLMLWRFGDQQWVKLDEIINENLEDNIWQFNFKVHDIAFHKGKFYAFQMTSSYECRVWVINPGDSSVSKQVICISKANIFFQWFFEHYDYLDINFVPFNNKGRLYLVIGATKDRICLEISKYKLIFLLKEGDDEGMWEFVENMEDKTFFIGYNVSFALPPPPRNLAFWKPNSIYWFSTTYPLSTIHMTDYKIKGCYPQMPNGLECLKRIFYPSYNEYFKLLIVEEDDNDAMMMVANTECQEQCTRLFFPPPVWVKWSCPTLDNVEVMFNGLLDQD